MAILDFLIPAALQAGAALFGSGEREKAAVETARLQKEAQEANIRAFERFREQQAAMQRPFQRAGEAGVSELQRQLTTQGLSPYAQTQLQESQRALNRQLAAGGRFASGAGLEALSRQAERITGQDVLRRQQIAQDLAQIGGQFAHMQEPMAQQPITTGVIGGAQARSDLGTQLANIASQTSLAMERQRGLENVLKLFPQLGG